MKRVFKNVVTIMLYILRMVIVVSLSSILELLYGRDIKKKS